MSNKSAGDSEQDLDPLTVSVSSSPEPMPTIAPESYASIYAKIKRASNVVPSQYYTLDEPSLWTTPMTTGTFTIPVRYPEDEEPTKQTTKIQGHELMAGDYILSQWDEYGRRVAHWNTRVISKNGVLGYKQESGKFVSAEKAGWTSGKHYEVVLPRPQPEVNEFGPVSP